MHARVAATLALAVAAAGVAIVWHEDRSHLGLVIGLLLAGLAFGLRDLVASLAGWLAVPYRVGDQVSLAEVGGEVIRVSPLRTTLRDDATGAGVSVSNAAVFASPVRLDAPGELAIGIPYGGDWRGAEAILLEEAARFDPRVSLSLTDSWVELAVRFDGGPSVRDELARAILAQLEDAGIAIASRTVEVTVGEPLTAERPAHVP
jgi:small-conductance mechanosensitive channel